MDEDERAATRAVIWPAALNTEQFSAQIEQRRPSIAADRR